MDRQMSFLDYGNANRSFLHWLILLCSLASVSGCGGPYDANLSGIVTLDGKAVPRGTVSFSPVNGGPLAYSPIDSDGSYQIKTGREVGLPSGEYVATVIANEPPQQSTAPGEPPPDGKPITPEWYRSKQSSGLKYKVEPGTNTFNLELTSQPPAGWKPAGRR
jgi:hypothetical protein